MDDLFPFLDDLNELLLEERPRLLTFLNDLLFADEERAEFVDLEYLDEDAFSLNNLANLLANLLAPLLLLDNINEFALALLLVLDDVIAPVLVGLMVVLLVVCIVLVAHMINVFDANIEALLLQHLLRYGLANLKAFLKANLVWAGFLHDLLLNLEAALLKLVTAFLDLQDADELLMVVALPVRLHANFSGVSWGG